MDEAPTRNEYEQAKAVEAWILGWPQDLWEKRLPAMVEKDDARLDQARTTIQAYEVAHGSSEEV